MIIIRSANEFSTSQLCQLQVHPSQIHYIETVEESLKEAKENPIWNPWAILHNETLIGFAMSGDWIDEQRTWLDRFLIDHRFQGQGYGKKALFQLIDYLIKDSLHGQLYLSLYSDNIQALHLYESFNFQLIQQKDIHGEQIMMLIKKVWENRKNFIQH